MRIEILVDGSVEPQIYPINKPKLSLGSGETCDIVISSDNISRKHVIIIVEGDSYFVVDQGSTNGTFINEERLVPGRRTEFTSFFPVRLGSEVLITLLSDDDPTVSDEEPLIPLYPSEDAPPAPRSRGAEETTKMISLSDLKKAKTADLVVKRDKVVAKKNEAKKAPMKSKRAKENQKFKFLKWVILAAMVAIGYYNIKIKSEEKEPVIARMGQVVPDTSEASKKPVVPKESPIELVPETEIFDQAKYTNFLNDIKCVTDIEKYFCERISATQGGKFGVVQIGTTIHLLIDGGTWIQEAKGIMGPIPPNLTPEIEKNFHVTVYRLAMALFFMKGFPNDIDWEKLKELKVSVVLHESWEGQVYLKIAAVIYPEGLKKFKSVTNQESMDRVRREGEAALLYTNEFYTWKHFL